MAMEILQEDLCCVHFEDASARFCVYILHSLIWLGIYSIGDVASGIPWRVVLHCCGLQERIHNNINLNEVRDISHVTLPNHVDVVSITLTNDD